MTAVQAVCANSSPRLYTLKNDNYLDVDGPVWIRCDKSGHDVDRGEYWSPVVCRVPNNPSPVGGPRCLVLRRVNRGTPKRKSGTGTTGRRDRWTLSTVFCCPLTFDTVSSPQVPFRTSTGGTHSTPPFPPVGPSFRT